MGSVDGQVALITGAAGGIGAATARLFATEGAAVVCADWDAAGATRVAEEIVAAGGRAVAVGVDVSVEAEVASAVAVATATFGRLDVLVAAAGIVRAGGVLDADVDSWDQVMAVNARGTWLMMKHAAPAMAGSGSMVTIASVAALMAVRGTASYTAAKGAIVALTREAAAELGPGIRVNCICPGTVRTAMPEALLRSRGGGDSEEGARITAERYLLGRLGSPEEIAATALFLGGPAGSFFTGAVLVADGGVTAQ